MSPEAKENVQGVASPSAEFSPESLNTFLTKAVLRSTAAFLILVWGVDIPFFAANKAGGSILAGFATAFLLAVPYVLLRRNLVRAAAAIYVVAGALLSSALVFFGRTTSPSTFQLAISVIAVLLLGRVGALWVSIFCLGIDFIRAVLDILHWPRPIFFPEPPIASWIVTVLAFVLAAPTLYMAMRTLRQAVEQIQHQLGERRKTEEHLHYQAQLIVQSPDPVIAIDNDRRVTSWNAAAARLIGWSEEEAIGKSLDEVIRYVPGSTPGAAVQEALAKTGHFHGELRWLTRSGSEIIVDSTIRVFRDPAGNQVGSVGGFFDTTERRRAEEALKRSEERLHLITETVPVGILVFDPAGKIVFANSPSASQLGLTPNDLLNRSHADPAWNFTDAAGNTIPIEERPVQKVLRTGKPVSGFHAATLAQGKRMFLSVSAAPILSPACAVEGVVMALEDITSRRDLEMKYQHGQRMEALGRLAGGVAHDFNNLLTVINGYSSLVLRRAGLNGSLKLPVEQILKAGEAAAELCQQLLAFSRGQSKSPRPMALNDVVRDTQKMLQRLVGEDIEFSTEIDPQAGMILADAGQVQQVLMNLVVNARDAMPSGGRLTISTANYTSPPDDPARDRDASTGDYVALIVEDTGLGMDQDTRRRIFEPFFTTKETGRGTGLGLSTVYGIVKQHGGWLRVESDLWKGARFSIYLPRVESVVPETPLITRSQAGGSEALLVVEDQAAVREFLIECLRSYGYSVLGVSSPAEALEVSRRPGATVDLLVTDMVMPGMTGKQLAENLNRIWPGIRVVLVSGYSPEQIEPLGLPSSQFTTLSKPFSPEVLATAVRNLLGAQKTSSVANHAASSASMPS